LRGSASAAQVHLSICGNANTSSQPVLLPLLPLLGPHGAIDASGLVATLLAPLLALLLLRLLSWLLLLASYGAIPTTASLEACLGVADVAAGRPAVAAQACDVITALAGGAPDHALTPGQVYGRHNWLLLLPA
jgi:hypothetical protein